KIFIFSNIVYFPCPFFKWTIFSLFLKGRTFLILNKVGKPTSTSLPLTLEGFVHFARRRNTAKR
ncbi:MAG: hypothetical protein KHY31_12850, partial [Clostridiales bacterium]|nr:hypothetical protein [Clostridiales bacterium]